jgi:Cdc6-like AAA superfamily ATPase
MKKQPTKLERALDLGAMLRAFKLEPLKESELAEFFYDDTMAIRTGNEWKSPLRNLFKRCTMPSTSNAHLLLGHRGCGKSTELNNLKQQFEKAGQSVYIFDCSLELDLFQANCWDIMMLITEGLCKIADEKKIALPAETVNAVLSYLKEDTELTKIIDNGVSHEASLGVKASTLFGPLLSAFASVKADARLSTVTSKVVKEVFEKSSSEWKRYTELIADFITDDQGNQPIIILESLDKLPMPEKIFDILQFTALSQMSFPVIYTFPMSQYYSSKFSTVRDLYSPHVLPMIKVSNFDELKSKNENGIDVIKKIVEKRADLALFDTEETDVLEHLIIKTGGSLRHLFDCIINASERAEWRESENGKIYLEDAESALSGLRGELTRQIAFPEYEDLVKIYKNIEHRAGITDHEFLLKMTQTSVVFEYQNGDRWHDLHPLIADFLKKQKVIKDEDK